MPRRSFRDVSEEDKRVLLDIARRMRRYDRLAAKSRRKERAGFAADIPEPDPYYSDEVIRKRPRPRY